ncbi:MAG: putative selenate ABC transporter substrate-binding protein [Planctomycetota bacterium]
MKTVNFRTGRDWLVGTLGMLAVVGLAAGLAGCGAESGGADKDSAGGEGAPAAGDEGAANWPKTLRVSAIPDEEPSELLRIYGPFADYLAKETGIEVKFTPVTDYAATVEGLAAGNVDLCWYGGYTSVQAIKQSSGNAERLVLRAEDAKFKSVFVAAPGSGIKSLKDLKGKTFSFGSESSTSGHLMPRSFLLAEGLKPEDTFSKFSFSGAHDKTALAVQAGTVDAGALNFLTWGKLVKNKKVDLQKVNVFWTTPDYVDYCWVASKNLPKDLREKLREAFLKLDASDPTGKTLLGLHRASKYLPANDADWKGIEDAAIAAGMLKK